MGFSSKRQCALAVVGSEETEQRETEVSLMMAVFKHECRRVLQFQIDTW